jgi:hypothetical protein
MRGGGVSEGGAIPTADDLAAHKFTVGEAPPEAAPRDIPWAYGRCRVTAMMVDPENLYVYWEVTEEGIESARAGLGAGGATAWLNLRVYDVTGRIFDGTNAHHFVDHRVERTDRQWFFHLGRPTSTACVEIGLMSREGYFVKIARSGRVDFPRREPSAAGSAEWMTVDPATGAVLPPLPGASCGSVGPESGSGLGCAPGREGPWGRGAAQGALGLGREWPHDLVEESGASERRLASVSARRVAGASERRLGR